VWKRKIAGTDGAYDPDNMNHGNLERPRCHRRFVPGGEQPAITSPKTPARSDSSKRLQRTPLSTPFEQFLAVMEKTSMGRGAPQR